MKKILFLTIGIFLLSLNFVSALSIQETLQQQIASGQITYTPQNGEPPNPMDVIKLALKNSPEFRKEFIKSIVIICIVMCLSIVDMVLRGFAMWRASKRNSKIWFWVLLLVSTLGILPLIYLIFVKDKKEHKK